MSRFAPIISLSEFKKLCETKLKIGEEEFYDFEFENRKITNDLSKVNFDTENFTIGNADESNPGSCFANYPCGYEVLENGLPVLFANAGGDWEHPICFCFYFDGKTMRAYIPSRGNVWNKEEKCAFGSDGYDWTNKPELVCDPDEIRKDIMNRIKIR
jgi:hypothetical protein